MNTVRTVAVTPDRALRLCMDRDPSGTASELILSLDFDDDVPGWRGHAATMALPANALPEIRAALEELEGEPARRHYAAAVVPLVHREGGR